jgi:acetolactate synthase-1/2/3 large subunit
LLLIVLCKNEQYASQIWNVLKYYPNGEAVRDGNHRAYARLREGRGGLRRRGRTHLEVRRAEPALRRAVDTVASGQTFLLDVIVNP